MKLYSWKAAKYIFVSFSWMKSYAWNNPHFLSFLWMNLCIWQWHIWSIVISCTYAAHSYIQIYAHSKHCYNQTEAAYIFHYNQVENIARVRFTPGVQGHMTIIWAWFENGAPSAHNGNHISGQNMSGHPNTCHKDFVKVSTAAWYKSLLSSEHF